MTHYVPAYYGLNCELIMDCVVYPLYPSQVIVAKFQVCPDKNKLCNIIVIIIFIFFSPHFLILISLLIILSVHTVIF